MKKEKKEKKDISVREFLLYFGLVIFLISLIFIAVFVFKFDITKFAERLQPMEAIL